MGQQSRLGALLMDEHTMPREARELPPEVLADLAGLVAEMEKDRLPGFDDGPPDEAEPIVARSTSFSSLVASADPTGPMDDAGPTNPAGPTKPDIEAASVSPWRQPLGDPADGFLAPQWVPARSGDELPMANPRSSWLRENWPFVLAAGFIALGVVLIVLVLTSPPGVTV